MKYSITTCDGKTTKGTAYNFGGTVVLAEQSYPTSQLSSSSNWGNSTNNSGYSGGGSYSSPETHIQQVNTALGGNVLGGAYHDKRQERDVFGDGINYQVKNMANNLNYYGFKDPKGIVLSDCALEDKDIGVLIQTLQPHPFNLTILDLSNNKLGYYSIENIFYGMRGSQEGVTTHVCKQIRSINFSNNLLDDNCANYIAKSLEYGRFPSLKYLDVSGNQITENGEGYFVNSIENLSKQDMAIILRKVTNNGFEAINKTLEFTTKSLQHVINKFAKKQWDTNIKVKKGCYDVALNVEKAFLGGIIKCSPLVENPPALFYCVLKDVLMDGLLQEDTMHCIGDINKELEKSECSIF